MNKIETSVGEVWLVSGETSLCLSEDIAFGIERSPIDGGELCNSTADPKLARTLAICYFCPAEGRYVVAEDESEWALLRQFWDCYMRAKASGSKMIGYNLVGYDLLFLIRRSWLMGVTVPRDAIMFSAGPYHNDTIIDLKDVWMCGMYDGFVSLDDLAKYFGVGETTSHELFHVLWQKNHQEAVEHLVTRVRLMHGCAVNMGLMPRTHWVICGA
jgi:hypothetical protein